MPGLGLPGVPVMGTASNPTGGTFSSPLSHSQCSDHHIRDWGCSARRNIQNIQTVLLPCQATTELFNLF